MRLKINRIDLLAKIESFKDQSEAVYAAELADYLEAVEQWRNAAVVAAKAVAHTLEVAQGDFTDDTDEDTAPWSISARYNTDTSELVVPVSLPRPTRPELVDYRIYRDAELVRACPDLTLSVGPDDHLYRYLAMPEADGFNGRRRR